MNLAILSWAALGLLLASSFMLLLTENWRWMIVALAALYLGMGGLVALLWPLGMAAVKLVIGWMAGAVLGSTPTSLMLGEDEFSGLSGRLFRLLAAGMTLFVVYSLAGPLQTRIPAPLPVLLGGLALLAMGLLHLSMTRSPLRMVIGLLTLMAGFEILYAAIETSVLVAGLLGVVNLGLALVGAYLMLSPEMEAEEEDPDPQQETRVEPV